MSANPEKVEFKGVMLNAKHKKGKVLYFILNDEIVQGRVVAVTKSVVATDANGKPLISENFKKSEETYTMQTSNGLWSRTNNVGLLYETIEELKANLKIREL